MKYKFKVGEDAVLLDDSYKSVFGSPWQGPSPGTINDTHNEMGKLRYRINTLWFAEEKIKTVSKETNPEYYL